MKYTVSLDLLVPVLIEIEADSEDSAEIAVLEMSRQSLLALANTENSAIGINIDGISRAPGQDRLTLGVKLAS